MTTRDATDKKRVLTIDRSATAPRAPSSVTRTRRKQTKFEPSEPVFMTQFAFNASATRDSLQDAQDEERATARLLGVMGGTLKSYFVSQTGEYDGVVIYSFPKNHDSRTFTTLLKASGKIDKLTTTKLMTSSDAAQCGKAAKEVHEMLNGDNK
jgi:THO complex subunit 3